MKALISIAVLLFSTLAFSDPTWHTSKIKAVYPQADGGAVIIFTQDHSSCLSSSNPDYYYLKAGWNGVTEEGFKNLYSAFLAAAAIGRDVQINFESSSASCEINRAWVSFQ